MINSSGPGEGKIHNGNRIIKCRRGYVPKWYKNAKVYCDGQLIMKVGSTQKRLNVDIWSGNHPFYTGSQKILDTEGRVKRFMRKYGISNKI